MSDFIDNLWVYQNRLRAALPQRLRLAFEAFDLTSSRTVLILGPREGGKTSLSTKATRIRK